MFVQYSKPSLNGSSQGWVTAVEQFTFILRRMITKLFQVLSNTPIRGIHGLGRVCAQPGPYPNYSGGGKYGPKPTQRGGQIFRFGSRRFQVLSGRYRVYHRGRNLARSGWNLAEFVEIWTKSGRIWRDLAESVEIWPRFRQITTRSRRIWSKNRNTSSER